jgi:hypothetical protein
MMMSDDDPNEKFFNSRRPMRQSRDASNPGTTPGIPSVDNAAVNAADPHGGKQRQASQPSMRPAGPMAQTPSTGRKGTSGGGPTKGMSYGGFKGQSPGSGGKLNTGGRNFTSGGGRGYGNANVSKGRGR